MLSLLEGEYRIVFAIFLSLLIGWRLRKPIFHMAITRSFVAKPNKRSSHSRDIPNIGGSIVFLAFIVSFMLFIRFDKIPEFQYMLLGAYLTFMVGVYDDLMRISPRQKLVGEIVAVMVLLLGGGFFIDNLYGLFGFHAIPMWVGVPLTFLAMVGLINAINLIDGIDGLSSGIALMDSAVFGFWFFFNEYIEYALWCAILCASIVPFFIINLFGGKSKMFMGDSGSLMVGFLLGVMSIKLCKFSESSIVFYSISAAPAVVFTILAIPILDTLRVFMYRVMHGQSPFTADKNHFHHKLLIIYHGVHWKATVTLLTLNIYFIVLSYLGKNWTNEILMCITLISFALFYIIANRLANQKS